MTICSLVSGTAIWRDSMGGGMVLWPGGKGPPIIEATADFFPDGSHRVKEGPRGDDRRDPFPFVPFHVRHEHLERGAEEVPPGTDQCRPEESRDDVQGHEPGRRHPDHPEKQRGRGPGPGPE